MVDVKFAKVKPDAIIPSKRKEDAGYDIYACMDERILKIPSSNTVLIPTGIASSCESGYAFVLRERSSTGSKGLGLRSGVIDSGYRGEWFIAITNHNCYDYYICKRKFLDENPIFEIENSGKIYPYEKAIAQVLLIPIPETNIEEISYEELYNIDSERGTGKIGSSNK